MTFRAKMLLIFTLAVAAAVGTLTWGVMRLTRQQFGQIERQRSDAVVAQFQRELTQRADEVTFAVQGLADAEGTLRMAINLNQPQADPSMYANDARGLAASRQLDFLELVGNDGVIISSVQSPSRVGSKHDWVTSETSWNQQSAFLSKVELEDEVELGLLTVRVVNVGAKNLYIIGGRRLDASFLQTLPLPSGMRALLYSNLEEAFVPGALTGATGAPEQPERLASFIGTLLKQPRPAEAAIQWTGDPAGAENFAAVPLTGRNQSLLGVLLVGSSQRDVVTTLTQIRNLALAAGGGALLFEILLGWWLSAQISTPLARLTAGAREVAAGSWTARVNVRGRDEVGALAREFNAMMRQLSERRELLMQTERVAAWREMAQRMSAELKEPLFHLNAALDELARSRQHASQQFDEASFDALKSLRAEFSNLKSVASQFSEFARMPPPRLCPVSVNDVVREVVKTFEPQFSAIGRPPISPELHLDESLPAAQADPDLLSRGLLNLLGHSVAAMPAGGTLTLRTALKDGAVKIEVSDTGATLASGDVGRGGSLPYATKLHGTGLGLATVQSVICDQGGRISVEWAPGTGSTFRIELPAVTGLAAPVRPQVESAPVQPPPVQPAPTAPAPDLASLQPSQEEVDAAVSKMNEAGVSSETSKTDESTEVEPSPAEKVEVQNEVHNVEPQKVEVEKSGWRPYKSMFS